MSKDNENQKTLDEYEEFVDSKKRDIRSTTERKLYSKVTKLKKEIEEGSIEYKRLMMIKEKVEKYERETKAKTNEALINQAESLIKKYESYEEEKKEYPPKNSELYREFILLKEIRREYRSKQLDYLIERLKEMNRYYNPGVDEKIRQLQEFYQKKQRLPNQGSEDEYEKKLGSFVSQFPRYKKINRIAKEKYIDIKNGFIDDTLKEALKYKVEHKQDHLKVSPNEELHSNLVSVGKLLNEIEEGMLKDEMPIHYIEGASERQLKLYKELGIEKNRRVSEEERKESINKNYIKVTRFIEKYHKFPTHSDNNTKEENDAWGIIKRYTDTNKKMVFTEEQKKELENLKARYGGKRGGISYPESIYAISFEFLLGDKCNKFHRNRTVHKVNVDLFLEIDGRKYAFFYDGYYYHDKKIIDDKTKTDALLKNNVVVIRVREYGLDNLGLEDDNLIIHQLTKANTSKDDYIEDVEKIANIIIKGSYKEILESKWDEINERAHAENKRIFTELKHIKDFLDFAYEHNVIPLSTGEGKEIYRNMNGKANYSHFALMVFHLATICFPAGNRRAWKERLISQGLSEDVLVELEKFLSPSNE